MEPVGAVVPPLLLLLLTTESLISLELLLLPSVTAIAELLSRLGFG